MALHRPAAVKGRAFQNPPDLIEGKFKLPEKEDLLQPRKAGFIIEAVAPFACAAWAQQADLIIIMQCAHTDARQTGGFPNGERFHPWSFPSEGLGRCYAPSP